MRKQSKPPPPLSDNLPPPSKGLSQSEDTPIEGLSQSKPGSDACLLKNVKAILDEINNNPEISQGKRINTSKLNETLLEDPKFCETFIQLSETYDQINEKTEEIKRLAEQGEEFDSERTTVTKVLVPKFKRYSKVLNSLMDKAGEPKDIPDIPLKEQGQLRLETPPEEEGREITPEEARRGVDYAALDESFKQVENIGSKLIPGTPQQVYFIGELDKMREVLDNGRIVNNKVYIFSDEEEAKDQLKLTSGDKKPNYILMSQPDGSDIVYFTKEAFIDDLNDLNPETSQTAIDKKRQELKEKDTSSNPGYAIGELSRIDTNFKEGKISNYYELPGLLVTVDWFAQLDEKLKKLRETPVKTRIGELYKRYLEDEFAQLKKWINEGEIINQEDFIENLDNIDINIDEWDGFISDNPRQDKRWRMYQKIKYSNKRRELLGDWTNLTYNEFISKPPYRDPTQDDKIMPDSKVKEKIQPELSEIDQEAATIREKIKSKLDKLAENIRSLHDDQIAPVRKRQEDIISTLQKEIVELLERKSRADQELKKCLKYSYRDKAKADCQAKYQKKSDALDLEKSRREELEKKYKEFNLQLDKKQLLDNFSISLTSKLNTWDETKETILNVQSEDIAADDVKIYPKEVESLAQAESRRCQENCKTDPRPGYDDYNTKRDEQGKTRCQRECDRYIINEGKKIYQNYKTLKARVKEEIDTFKNSFSDLDRQIDKETGR